MDPKKVDVNVHPTKLEVRFQEEGKVFKAIYNSIKQALLKYDLVPSPEKDYKSETPNDILKNINVNNGLFSNKIESNSINSIDNNSSNNLDGNKIDGTTTNEIMEEKHNNVKKEQPQFSEFKNTMNGLDSETRKRFIDELTQTKTPEEIGIKLADMTKAILNNDEISKSTENKIDDEKEEKISLENSDNEDLEETANKITDNFLEDNKQQYNDENNKEESFEEMYKRLFGRDINEAKKEYEEKQAEEEAKYPISPITGEEISMFEKEGIDNNPQYKFIGIAFKTYIILTMGEDLYILDQHAAHERIMYEKVKANYYSDGEKDCQLMLLPDIIKLSTREMGIFKDNKEMFNKAGFAVEEFGDNTVKLTGVPEFCLDFDTQELFLETLDEINTVARTAKQEIEDKFLATVACKAAVKAHMALSKEEVESLMNQLLRLPNPFTCPHGRPTVIKLSKNDIEKKFSRR